MDIELSRRAYQLWNDNNAIEAGKIIYESISQNKRPFWASTILSFCIEKTRTRAEFVNVINTAKNPNKWKDAHEIFQSVRKLTLRDEEDGCPDDVFSGELHLAENTAKVTYNAGNFPAPFDHNAGWWIIKNLKFIVDKVDEKEFEQRVLKVAFEFEIND